MRGTSTELRRKIVGRHSVYFLLFIYISFVNSMAITAAQDGWGIFSFNTNQSWIESWSDI